MEVLTQKRRTAIIDKKRNMMDGFNLPDPLKCKDFLVFQIGIDRVQGALEGQFFLLIKAACCDKKAQQTQDAQDQTGDQVQKNVSWR